MDIESIGKDILDCAYAIHTRFGSGLLEKAYRVILATELKRLGHKVEESRREPVFAKQCLTYLRLLDKHLGFVINFGMPSLKDGIDRVVNKL